MTNSSNLIRGKHLESTALESKRYILTEILNVTNALAKELANMGGGSSAVEVFTGAGISSAGSSGFVPAPQIGDEDKFLCGNGTWAAIPGGGASFPIASASTSGLMSAEDKQHLDALFQDSADFTDAVITGVGGKFVPSVDSVPDFISYKEFNLPYLDNKLKLIMEGNSALGVNYSDYASANDSVTLQGGNSPIRAFFQQPGSYWQLCICSEGHNTLTIATDSSSLENEFSSFRKVSESACSLLHERKVQKSWGSYPDIKYFRTYKVAANGDISSVSSNSICTAASSLQSAEGSSDVDFFASFFDPNHICFLAHVDRKDANGDTAVYSYTTIAINSASASQSRVKAATTIGTTYWYDSLASKTDLADINTSFSRPQFTFSEDQCTISSSSSRTLPFISYKTDVYNSSGSITGGGQYVLIHHGCYGGAPSLLQLTTLSGGVTSTLSPWLEDDDNLIAGFWRKRNSSDVYAVTFKKGTFSTSSDKWFDSCSTVWLFDFLSPQLFKTNKKLSDIINDLII